ncbi:MAG: Gx transporter family protein [Oscillospiraceae bacterium]|nr:Gx transporter family protein [Oscillospiraceae bacterium]
MQKKQPKLKKLTIMAALTTAALIIFIIEAQIQLPIPIPGAKLGLANTITLFVLFFPTNDKSTSVNLKSTDALMILICRILLGAIFTGRILALALSLSGGLLSFAAMIAAKRIVTNKQIWVCGAIGGIFHNIGQILAAILITETPAMIAYLPILIIIGIITGTLTGLITQTILLRLPKGRKF